MTDNEIIKDLECCRHPLSRCKDCSIIKGGFCFDHLKTEALDLIKRLKAENEDLRKDIVTAEEYAWQLKAKNEALQMDNEQLKSDIINERMNLEHIQAENEALISAQETLQKHIEKQNEAYPCKVNVGNNCLVYAKSLDDYDNLIGDISAEAIKEFAERLKDKKFEQSVDANTTGYLLGEDDINFIVEEMVGDAE